MVPMVHWLALLIRFGWIEDFVLCGIRMWAQKDVWCCSENCSEVTEEWTVAVVMGSKLSVDFSFAGGC